VENGEFVSVANQEEENAKAIAAAKATLNKTRNINIRLSERDWLIYCTGLFDTFFKKEACNK
jgi:hypothetical protein